MAEQASTLSPLRALDMNADPISGAAAFFYRTGTDTLEPVYTDSTLTTVHPSPLLADGEGVFPPVFHSDTYGIKVIVTDGIGVIQNGYPIDPVPMTASATQAASIVFSPITGNPADDVQEAIAVNTAEIIQNSQNLDNASETVTTGGVGNAYTVAAANTFTSYEAGQSLLLRADRANTGAITLNVDGLGAKAVQYYSGGGALVDIDSDELSVGTVFRVIYDGTRFVMPRVAARDDLRGVVEKATEAEAEGGTQADVFPDVVGVKSAIDAQRPVNVFARGAMDSGAATPVWLGQTGFDASIVKNGTGEYEVTFSTAQPDALYSVAMLCAGAGGVFGRFFITYAVTAADVTIYVTDVNGTAVDPDSISIIVAR